MLLETSLRESFTNYFIEKHYAMKVVLKKGIKNDR